MLRALILPLLMLTSAPLKAETAQDLAQRLLAATGAPAIGVGVLENGQRDIAVAGVRRIGGDAAQVGDAWHIGSNGKSMTALLARWLAAEGRVSLDERLGDALGAAAGRFSDVTLKDLLNHTGGLPANAEASVLKGLSGARRDGRADRLVYAKAVLAGRPGEGFAYSNAGYVLAGLMLERAEGDLFEALMQAKVFDRLGLASAGFGAPEGGILGHRAKLFGGLAPVPPGPEADNVPAMSPAGRMHLSLNDHLTYLSAYLDGHAPRPGGDVYDMGWIPAFGGWGHEGSNTYWYSLMMIWPDRNKALILNANVAGDAVAKAFRAVARDF